MPSSVPYCEPRHWLRISKYLLPFGLESVGKTRSRAPREQRRVSQLAAEHPDHVRCQVTGDAELLPAYSYSCYTSGESEIRTLPPEFAAPSFVATIKDGLSFGRHCCVIGPDRKAMRETGFHLDGEVISGCRPVSPWRLQYWRKRWEGDVTTRPWLPPKCRLDARVAVLNARFSHNFFHWLIDILPRLAPLKQLGEEVDYYVVDSMSSFQRTVLQSLGIQKSQLIQPHCRLLLEARELLVPSMPTPRCLREFAKMLRSSLVADRTASTRRRIFISRRKTGTRTLANEFELEAMLARYGFETHCMEEYSLAEQASLIHESQIIVATHGAGLANLIFSKPNAHVIEIVPAARYNATCYPKKSRVFGLHHQLVFADRARHKQILRVSVDVVERALQQAMSEFPRSVAA